MLTTKNQQLKTNNKPSGFTLIEILVVLGILGVVVSLGTGMFFWTLKGSAKAQAVAEVKQSGTYALNVMERMIRNATDLDFDPAVQTSITIENPDGGQTIFSCMEIDGKDKIASSSASLIGSGIEVLDCGSVFTVTSGVAGVRPARVDISFTLKKTDTGLKLEDQAAADFRTSVTLRNF